MTFRFLNTSVGGFVLSFIGLKMIIAPFFHIESFHSLLIVGGPLNLSVVASLIFPDDEEESDDVSTEVLPHVSEQPNE